MGSEKGYDRKGLKARLSCITMIYLDGLNPRQQNRVRKYVDEKVNAVVNHYVRLLRK